MKDFSILIVDDQETDRYILKRSLGKTDISCEVFESSDGKEALGFLEDYDQKKKTLGPKFPPLIIFLDINMPLVNGFEFLEAFSKLRDSQVEYKTCVIMMFSSSQNKKDKDQAFTYGFVKDFITKGAVSPEELKEKMGAVIQELS